MYITILAGIIALIFSYIYSRNADEKHFNRFFFYGIFPMIACMVGFVLQLSLVVSGFIPTEKRLVSEIPLVSIKDRNGFEGSFYILGGSIGDTSYYQYYYMTQGGGYKRGKINADYSDVTIIETDDGKPTIKIYKTSLEKSYECWFIPLDNPKAYVFTIPKGSIKKESKLE